MNLSLILIDIECPLVHLDKIINAKWHNEGRKKYYITRYGSTRYIGIDMDPHTLWSSFLAFNQFTVHYKSVRFNSIKRVKTKLYTKYLSQTWNSTTTFANVLLLGKGIEHQIDILQGDWYYTKFCFLIAANELPLHTFDAGPFWQAQSSPRECVCIIMHNCAQCALLE